MTPDPAERGLTSRTRETPTAAGRWRRPGARLGAALVFLALGCSLYTVFKPFNLASDWRPAQQWAVHRRVLAGEEVAPSQYQMYVHDQVLEALFRHVPGRTAARFAAVHVAYYAAGMFVFMGLLYRLCLRYSAPGAVGACLYLVACFPVFWYDNHYHPGDPWGAALAVLLVESVLDGRRGAGYLGLLLVSGFVWEKHVFLPVSVAAAEWLRRDGRRTTAGIVGEMIAACAFAGAGQIVLRMWLGTARAWGGPTLTENLASVPLYLAGVAVVFGPALAFQITRPQRTPLVIRTLTAQLPFWMAIYLVFGGWVCEMRGILVLVPYTWPAAALAIDRWVVHAGRQTSQQGEVPPAHPSRPPGSPGET